MDKLKRALGGQSTSSPEPQTASSEENLFSEMQSLSWGTRIKGFAICFGLGFLFSLMGACFLMIPFKGLKLFCVFYSLGNVMAIFSTLFLMGPMSQLKKMFSETRFIATLLMLVLLTLTLMSGLWWHKKGLTILFCMCQFFAMTWYALSYIPYARDAVKKTFSSCIEV